MSLHRRSRMLQAIPSHLAEQAAQTMTPPAIQVQEARSKNQPAPQQKVSVSVRTVASIASPEPVPNPSTQVVVNAQPVQPVVISSPLPQAQRAPEIKTVNQPVEAVAQSTPLTSPQPQSTQPIREVVSSAPSGQTPTLTPGVSDSSSSTSTDRTSTTPAVSPSSNDNFAQQQAELSKRLAEIVARDRVFKDAQKRETLITQAYTYANEGKFAQARRLLQNPVVPNAARTEVLSTISSLEQSNGQTSPPKIVVESRQLQTPQTRSQLITPSKSTIATQIPTSIQTIPQLPPVTQTPLPHSEISLKPTPTPLALNPKATAGEGSDYRTTAPDTLPSYTRPTPIPGQVTEEFTYPLPAPAPVTSGYGWRVHPVTRVRRFHGGVDLGAAQGVPVLATRQGRVVSADRMGGYGLAVVLEHADGTQDTLYAHLSQMFVRPGDQISAGTVIGQVGSTGLSTGPHLHYEARSQVNAVWKTMDPSAELDAARNRLAQVDRNPS
jgi:murein DD-endopeptidase MepM/ murein hydrolase activator NlpD